MIEAWIAHFIGLRVALFLGIALVAGVIVWFPIRLLVLIWRECQKENEWLEEEKRKH